MHSALIAFTYHPHPDYTVSGVKKVLTAIAICAEPSSATAKVYRKQRFNRVLPKPSAKIGGFMSDESWTLLARNGSYLASEAATRIFPMDYAIEGLMPATGATVWFGAGSTGKTQLLLWLTAHIAARGDHLPKHWLGSEIRVRGHVLVLTAEDLREHLLQRIGSIARKLVADAGGTADDVQDICDRVHVMAFLSMEQTEFTERNPCLFERGRDGRWGPTKTLTEIEEFLQHWNDNADDEDQIVGVILDSAVSMSGFEMSNSEATTNFLFHLNRMSRRQNMFWAVIGHTPKDVGKKADDAAVERLRGSAMWSTTPRTVIEVRLAGPSEDLSEVRAAFPDLTLNDVVVVSIAKANSQDADFRPRALRRIKDGAFEDLTPYFSSIFRGASSSHEEAGEPFRPSDPGALWDAVIDLIASITDGGRPNASFTRADLRNAYDAARPSKPILNEISGEVDGRYAKRRLTLAHFLNALKKLGALKQKGMLFFVVDLDRARRPAEPEEPRRLGR